MKKYSGYFIATLWFLLGAIALVAFIGIIKGNINPFMKCQFSEEHVATRVENFNADSVISIGASIVADKLIIEGAQRHDIQVTISTRFKDGGEPTVSLRDGLLYIEQQKKRSFSPFFSNEYVEILIPYEMMQKETFIVRASSVSGSVNLNEITASEIDISSTSGDLHADGCAAKKINAQSVSGNVKFEASECSTASLASTSGSVLFFGKADELSLSSTSGSVKANLDSMLKANSSFRTMSGSVRVILPENDGFTMKYASMSGSISNRFTGLRAKKSGTNIYKNGGITLTTESMSGSISIE